MEIMQAGGPGADNPQEVAAITDINQDGQPDSLPGVPGSRQAADGKHYIPHQGGYMEVAPLEAEQNAVPV